MQLLHRRGAAAPILLGLGGLLGAFSAGCGSSSSSATAHIRGADFSVNGGTTGVLVNSTAVGGDLLFGQTSGFNYIGQGTSAFSFTTSAAPAGITISGTTTSVIPPSSKLQLNNNGYYTAYLIGRADVAPLTSARADPRFLQTVVAGDKGAAANYQSSPTGAAAGAVYADPPSGQANIRILNAAPDAGPVDVLIGGKPAFTGVTYPVLPLGLLTDQVAAGNPVTAYSALPSGTISVQVNAAGTATVLVPPTTLSIGSGQSYTVVVTEPAATPTYSLATEAD